MGSSASAPLRLLLLTLPNLLEEVRGDEWILPTGLECTSSSFTVAVSEAATERFGCPEYFHPVTCCAPASTTSIGDKLEDVVSFATRVLAEQGDSVVQVTLENGASEDACVNYYQRVLGSRVKNFELARKAAEAGIGILESAVMHLLCAACFVCSLDGKTQQIDAYTVKALQSLQQQMSAILLEQLHADVPEESQCTLPLVASFREGVIFPAWGRFVPEMPPAGLLNTTFATWMDRVLTLLLELPSTLQAELALLRLAFFYADRPESDAFALLHAALPDRTFIQGSRDGKSSVADDAMQWQLPWCKAGNSGGLRLRLLVSVDRSFPSDDLRHAWSLLMSLNETLDVLWVATAAEHIKVFTELAPRVLAADVVWRRFYVTNLDALSTALCPAAPAGAVWVTTLTEGLQDFQDVVRRLGDVARSPRVEDLEPMSWPSQAHPVRQGTFIPHWPSSSLEAYLANHAAALQALHHGTRHDGSRILVYTCSPLTLCGGHGDRLNGMLGAAVVALLSGRLFFIDAQRPVPLTSVLRPAKLDWRMYGSPASMPATFNFNDDLVGFEADPRRVLDNKAEVLRFISNQRLSAAALQASPAKAEELGLSQRPRLHSDLFKLLFQPAPALQRRLAARQLPQGRRTIGIHFRAGDQMPKHWKDPPRHSLAELDEFLDCAVQLEEHLAWDAVFVLFADTDKVLEAPRVVALQEAGKLLWPATADSMIHLDRSPPQLSVRGLLQVWADWWTLAFDVDALVLCHSGFGATALEIGPARPAVLGQGCVWADASTS